MSISERAFTEEEKKYLLSVGAYYDSTIKGYIFQDKYDIVKIEEDGFEVSCMSNEWVPDDLNDPTDDWGETVFTSDSKDFTFTELKKWIGRQRS